LLRLRSQVISRATSFFEKEGFIQTHPPIITSSDCEGAGEVFSVQSSASDDIYSRKEHFFKSPKYLTVSSQLHLEALAQSVGKVWTLSPTFRAEKSDTPRHLSEFYMLESEMAFSDDLGDVMDVVERLLRNITDGVLNSRIGEELLIALGNEIYSSTTTNLTEEQLFKRWKQLIDGRWPRITYAEALKILQDAELKQEATFESLPSFGGSFHVEHERFIAEKVGQGCPVFVTDYPRAIKPFYMARSKNPSPEGRPSEAPPKPTAACFDLLVPEVCEIVGGSMREHRLPILLRSMRRHGLLRPRPDDPQDNDQQQEEDFESPPEEWKIDETCVPENLQWYVQLRRYGTVPHGGFGLGFDRLLSYLSGASNIRDVVGYPRWFGRCEC
jgi:asparaginyl-tRNA synthetase